MIPRYSFFLILLLILHGAICGQPAGRFTFAADRHELSKVISHLASPEMEGRETGTPGGNRAASFIADRMKESGLQPCQIPVPVQTFQTEDYFRYIMLYRFMVQPRQVIIGNETEGRLDHGTDFTVEYAFQGIQGNFPLVFAGYGIILPNSGYNNYRDLDIKGKIVIMMEGYPGEGDTLGEVWKGIRTCASEDAFDIEKRCRLADSLGAIAVMVLDRKLWEGKQSAEQPEPAGCSLDPLYQDAEYLLPGSSPDTDIACIHLNLEGSRKVSALTGITPGMIRACFTGAPMEQIQIKSNLELDLPVMADTLEVPNILGMIPGADTSRTVIIGAHYDHLGKRGSAIYYGADDNASGVSGLLALARSIKTSEVIPPCNLVFASWTAEEKGLLGSAGFVSVLPEIHGVELYFNMDMISRSDPSDSARRIVSIGTRTCDSALRTLAEQSNHTLKSPLKLDLWDVSGHHGSDYASFTGRDIPVMTFFSGFHSDYHSPCDLPEKSDTEKMTAILELLVACLNSYLALH